MSVSQCVSCSWRLIRTVLCANGVHCFVLFCVPRGLIDCPHMLVHVQPSDSPQHAVEYCEITDICVYEALSVPCSLPKHSENSKYPTGLFVTFGRQPNAIVTSCSSFVCLDLGTSFIFSGRDQSRIFPT